MKKNIRVRFAPSPTGFMHLGNVRASLMNYLFARQHAGTFILRIEDTDAQRNLEEAELRIIQDLKWLGLRYQEGPHIGGNHGPYLQSDRTHLYQEQLNTLIETRRAYRCFCSPEELEKKRQEQIAAHKPPRYDRTCLHFSDDKIKLKLSAGKKFIWRFAFNNNQLLDMVDMAKGTITFDTQHFSDFALTRDDGSFTFIFANFVDDFLMEISHVIRGEDHTSNTAMQLALYDAFAAKKPVFWHLPILCNEKGEKLSKRDFGFSLLDLKNAGYLHEAVCNYLAIIGSSFAEEIQTLDELARNFNFAAVHSSGTIRYDVEKLTWVNQQWIERIALPDLTQRAKPFLVAAIPEAASLDDLQLEQLVHKVRPELKTLLDIVNVIGFYFRAPAVEMATLHTLFGKEKTDAALSILQNTSQTSTKESFLADLKTQAKAAGLSIKEIFVPLRFVVTGKTEGLGAHDIIDIFSFDQIQERIARPS